MDKKFKPYPARQIRLEDDVWEALKEAKLKHGKNWNKFIKELLKQKP